MPIINLKAYLALGHYQVSTGKKNIILNEKMERWLKNKEWNFRGAIAAAERCNKYLNPTSPDRVISGRSPAIKKLREEIWSASFGSSLSRAVQSLNLLRRENVLIIGETGTGKERIAAIIAEAAFHKSGTGKPQYRIINASAIPETLLESELFGHKKGSFTGANSNKKGMLEEADNGVFFFDEIGDLPLHVQPKILRALEEGKIRRIGEDKEKTINVKFIGATHKNLEQMIQDDKFRKDLFYRFNGFIINAPPMRELNEEDFLDIGRSFAEETDASLYKDEIEPKLIKDFYGHKWAGNVRELGNKVRNLILRGEVPSFTPDVADQNILIPENITNCTWTLEELNNWYAKQVKNKYQNNMSKASKALGISYSKFCRKYKE